MNQKQIHYPVMHRVRQVPEAPRVSHIEETLSRELGRISLGSYIKPGMSVAITAGSRGVANIVQIFNHLGSAVRALGGEPFLFPAMGSHGGGTAPGQVEILQSLGITEASAAMPIVSSMDVVEVGRSSHGFPVLVDRHAAEADAVIVVNRVKPHTEYDGPIESGLMKMMAIGMGKHLGCLEVHKQTVHYGYRQVIPEIGQIILEKLPVRFGVAMVENVYDDTAILKAVPADRIREEEERLLEKAKSLMARLPVRDADILIIDEMGKDVSGTGMDTNVIGRIMFIGEPEPSEPRITRIVVLDLTKGSHGNGIGVGLADYTTRRLLGKIDFDATRTNAMASMSPEKGRIPVTLATDRDAVDAALATIGAVDPEAARVIHIKNTLELAEMDVSQPLLAELTDREDIQIKGLSGPLAFAGDGSLPHLRFAS